MARGWHFIEADLDPGWQECAWDWESLMHWFEVWS